MDALLGQLFIIIQTTEGYEQEEILMPTCHYCGRQMDVLRASTTGRSGGGGARYRCKNTPHPRCPICNKTMERNFYFQGPKLIYRDLDWHCGDCELKARLQMQKEQKCMSCRSSPDFYKGWCTGCANRQEVIAQ